MGRKTLWRTFTLRSQHDARQIEAAYRASRSAVGRDKVFTRQVNHIETNISMTNLRLLFRGACIRMPECVIDTMPLEERVKEWAAEEVRLLQHEASTVDDTTIMEADDGI